MIIIRDKFAFVNIFERKKKKKIKVVNQMSERELKREIATSQGTRPNFVEIENVQELGGDERKVYVKVKGFKRTVLMRGNNVLATMVRV